MWIFCTLKTDIAISTMVISYPGFSCENYCASLTLNVISKIFSAEEI